MLLPASQAIAVGDCAHIRHLSLEHATLTTIGCEAYKKQNLSIMLFNFFEYKNDIIII